MPKLSSVDAAIHAAHLLIEALKTPHPMIPLNNLLIQQQQALQQLADIFSITLPQQDDTRLLRVQTPSK